MEPKTIAIIVIIAVIAVFLLIGYAVKKRIPTNKVQPFITLMGKYTNCKWKVKLVSRILPFVPEKATINCNKPALMCPIPNLHIVATGRKSFKILNAKSFSKGKYSICGEQVSSDDCSRIETRSFLYQNFTMSLIPEKGQHAGQFLFDCRF